MANLVFSFFRFARDGMDDVRLFYLFQLLIIVHCFPSSLIKRETKANYPVLITINS